MIIQPSTHLRRLTHLRDARLHTRSVLLELDLGEFRMIYNDLLAVRAGVSGQYLEDYLFALSALENRINLLEHDVTILGEIVDNPISSSSI